MTIYEKFRSSSLDIEPVGLFCGPQRSNYPCTPSGSRIIAWATEVEGMHFCQVPELGDTVFVVNPSAAPEDCVYPVANSLKQFIGLICSCRSVEAIANAYQCSRFCFHTRTASAASGMKTRSVLRALENIYHPEKISDPYETITTLQSSFDYDTIPLQDKYLKDRRVRPNGSQWFVNFDTDWGEPCKKGAAAKELAVNRVFHWYGERWCVPAIYLSENGIIVDTYTEVPHEAILGYSQKWADRQENTLSIPEKLSRDLENPLAVPASGSLAINSKVFASRKTFLAVWNPYSEPSGNIRSALKHYELDRNKGYLFRRDCFLRKGSLNNIRTIDFTLSAQPVPVPGPCFTAPPCGKSTTFRHPQTNLTHTLTVISENQEALEPNFLSNHPCCYTKLHYTLAPALQSGMLRICDSAPGDPWDGSSQILDQAIKNERPPTSGHIAFSSLRYAPAESVQWQYLFKQKLRHDIHVRLLP